MAGTSYVRQIDYIDSMQFKKNGTVVHALFFREKGALIPALDVSAFAFPEYKRQDECSRAPKLVRDFAAYLIPIQDVQASLMGQRALKEIYFLQQQPCQKFPMTMELCDYNGLQSLKLSREKKGVLYTKKGHSTLISSEQQVVAVGKLMDFLKQCNEKHGFKKSAPVSAEEYEKLLKEVQYYRQYFAKTAEIRQQMGITFPVQNAS